MRLIRYKNHWTLRLWSWGEVIYLRRPVLNRTEWLISFHLYR